MRPASANIGASFPKAGKRDWAAQTWTPRIGVLGGENNSDRLGFDEARRKLPFHVYPEADYATASSFACTADGRGGGS